MKTLISAVAIAISALAAGQALAADPAASKTRAEVKAELAEAIRSGNMPANVNSGVTLKQLYPNRYEQQPAVVGKTRAEVKAALAKAIRNGNMPANVNSGVTLKQLYPGNYETQS